MSVVRFIADLHLSHKHMAERRGFKDIASHDYHIMDKWNAVVNKRDLTYILGDVTMETSVPYKLLDHLNGRKIVVLGNHDLYKDVPKLFQHVESVAGMIKYKGLFLTHCPIIPSELEYRVSYNIHGHIHQALIPDDRYVNVSCEQVDYTPKTLEELGLERKEVEIEIDGENHKKYRFVRQTNNR